MSFRCSSNPSHDMTLGENSLACSEMFSFNFIFFSRVDLEHRYHYYITIMLSPRINVIII